MSHATHADASRPTIRVNNKLGPRGTLNGRQSKFVDEYMSNGQNGASAYRKAYGSKCSSLMCGKMAHKLLQHPTVARAVRARVRMIELAREGRLEAQQATDASRPTIWVNNKLGPRGTLNGRQSKFVDE